MVVIIHVLFWIFHEINHALKCDHDISIAIRVVKHPSHHWGAAQSGSQGELLG